MNNLYAMLPCYNEQDDIIPLVNEWVFLVPQLRKLGYSLGVYCIDDKSTDNTNQVIQQLCADFPDIVHLIEHKVNKGLGGVLQTSFNTFNDVGQNGDILILMDGDNTHDPNYSLNMIPLIESGTDCVIASRYCAGSVTKGVSGFRLILSWGARFFYSLILGVKNVKDYTCGYRAYNYLLIKNAIEKYGDNFVQRRSFACMMESLYKLSKVGATFKEIAFTLRYDKKLGMSKMKVLKTVWDSIGTAIQLKLEVK